MAVVKYREQTCANLAAPKPEQPSGIASWFAPKAEAKPITVEQGSK